MNKVDKNSETFRNTSIGKRGYFNFKRRTSSSQIQKLEKT